MRVLVTRPAEDAARTAAVLEARGHKAVLAPLLEVRFHDGPDIPLDGVQAILATSANGVRALARRTARRDLPLFAVGPQTADAAHESGFAIVRNAQGDAKALAAATAQWATPAKGVLFHARGAEGDGALAAMLKDKGFETRSEVLYDVAAAGDLPPAAREALAQGAVDAALFFSPRSARVFADRAVGLDTRGLIALCISAATAGTLAPLAFREIRIAAQPNQDALLACLD